MKNESVNLNPEQLSVGDLVEVTLDKRIKETIQAYIVSIGTKICFVMDKSLPTYNVEFVFLGNPHYVYAVKYKNIRRIKLTKAKIGDKVFINGKVYTNVLEYACFNNTYLALEKDI